MKIQVLIISTKTDPPYNTLPNPLASFSSQDAGSSQQTCSTLVLEIEIEKQSKQSKRPKTITTTNEANIVEALQKFQSQVCVVIASVFVGARSF